MYDACVQLKKEGAPSNELKSGYLMKVLLSLRKTTIILMMVVFILPEFMMLFYYVLFY
jgi:hypothetical protein